MNELFDIPESKAPRLRWMEKHDIRRHRADLDDENLPWSAWFPENEHESGLPMDPEACGYGVTENDAIVDLAVKHKIKLWNEE
jgi:hypothetical protein